MVLFFVFSLVFFRGLFLHTVVHTCQYNLVSCLVFFFLVPFREQQQEKLFVLFLFCFLYHNCFVFTIKEEKAMKKKLLYVLEKQSVQQKKMYFT